METPDIAELKARLRRKEAELESYRSDFAILVDQENQITQLIAVCDNTTYLTECFETSLQAVEELASDDKVPGFEELFELSDARNYRGQLQIVNGDYADGLKSVCTKIDTLKSEVAKKIKDLKNDVDNLSWSIQILS